MSQNLSIDPDRLGQLVPTAENIRPRVTIVQAVQLSEPPQKIARLLKNKKTRAAKIGKKYEDDVAAALHNTFRRECIQRNVWFQYRLPYTPRLRYAEVDILIKDGELVLVVECKNTLRWNEARSQISNLYMPLARQTYTVKMIVPLIVCRHLTSGPQVAQLFAGPKAAVCGFTANPTMIPVWHYNPHLEDL